MNRNVWLRLDNSRGRKPFCQITLKNTPEVAGANGLADALIRLDFISALADQRRFRLVNDLNVATVERLKVPILLLFLLFSYVTSLMHILFGHDRFRMLSGASQKILFKMLEVAADQV